MAPETEPVKIRYEDFAAYSQTTSWQIWIFSDWRGDDIQIGAWRLCKNHSGVMH